MVKLYCDGCMKTINEDYYTSVFREVLCVSCAQHDMEWECYKHLEPLKLVKFEKEGSK